MIDGFVRNIHSVEAESDELSSMFGDWSWSTTKNYKCVKEVLKKYLLCRFDKFSEHPEDKRPQSTAHPLHLFSFSESIREHCVWLEGALHSEIVLCTSSKQQYRSWGTFKGTEQLQE